MQDFMRKHESCLKVYGIQMTGVADVVGSADKVDFKIQNYHSDSHNILQAAPPTYRFYAGFGNIRNRLQGQIDFFFK